jgi:DNA polymerase-3 subunit alpha
MNSIIKPTALIERAEELNMPAIAVTDYCAFAAIHDAYKAVKKTKLIVGVEVNFVNNIKPFIDFSNGELKQKPEETIKKLVFLAKNQTGYQNLLKLNKIGFDHKFGKIPLVDFEFVKTHSDGVICLTGDSSGIIGAELSNDFETVKNNILLLKEIFNEDLIIELVANNLNYNNCSQLTINRAALKLAQELDLLPIVTSNARYLEQQQHKILDLVMAIKDGRAAKDTSRPRYQYPQLYLHSEEEIVNFMKSNFGNDDGNRKENSENP